VVINESLPKNQIASMIPSHCVISVPDIEASISWYKEMFRFTVLSSKFDPFWKAKIAFIGHGNFKLKLFEVDQATVLPDERRIPNLDIRTHGTKHVAYAVKDINTLMFDLKTKGVDVAMDVFPMQGNLVAFIRDNAGNLIELIERNAAST